MADNVWERYGLIDPISREGMSRTELSEWVSELTGRIIRASDLENKPGAHKEHVLRALKGD